MKRESAKALDVTERLVATCDVLAELGDSGFEMYEADVRTRWAIEMGLIRLGEEVSRIPAEVRSRFPDQPWRVIIDMRNLAAHQYDTLTTHRVWDTLLQDIPALRTYVAEVMIPALRSDRDADRLTE